MFPKLQEINQTHLTDHWEALSPIEQRELKSQIEWLNPALYKQQKALLQQKKAHAPFTPLKDIPRSGNLEDLKTGFQHLPEMGTIILAGGQGTRLGFNHPKGMYPISPVKKKSLFQLFAEKRKAASKQIGAALPLAIMTSPQNHEETVKHLGDEPISFFQQGELPLLNQQEDWFLSDPSHIAMGADGNGRVFEHFFHSGLWNQWYENGIRYLNIVLIDNIFADPFDANLLGHLVNTRAEAIIKCTERQGPDEKVGLLVKQEGGIRVIEYSELSEEERCLPFPYANLSLFCLTMEAVKKLAHVPFPLHVAIKEQTYKFETFIFDFLPYLSHISTLSYPREACFHPLKNKEGPYSPSTVQAHMEKQALEIISSLTGHPVDIHPFELSQEFYYPTPELKERWKGKQIPKTTHYL